MRVPTIEFIAHLRDRKRMTILILLGGMLASAAALA